MGNMRLKFQLVLFVLLITASLVIPFAMAQENCGGDNAPCAPLFPTGYESDESETRSPQRLKINVKRISSSVGNHAAKAVSPKASSGSLFRRPMFGLNHNQSVTGLSAGDFIKNIGLWANFAYTASKDENPATESDADLYNFILGADYTITEKIVAGLSFTYEDMERTTRYEAGGEMTSDGVTIGPYFAMLINDYLGFDINGGYSWISIEQERNRYIGEDGPDVISSSPDAERYFITLNINGYYYMDNWNFAGNLGYIYATEDQDAFVESNNKPVESSTVDLSQIYLNLEASYSFASCEPYLNLGYEYDATYDDHNTDSFGVIDDEKGDMDSDGLIAGAGVRFLLFQTLQGDIQVSSIFGRDAYKEYALALNLRYDF